MLQLMGDQILNRETSVGRALQCTPGIDSALLKTFVHALAGLIFPSGTSMILMEGSFSIRNV